MPACSQPARVPPLTPASPAAAALHTTTRRSFCSDITQRFNQGGCFTVAQLTPNVEYRVSVQSYSNRYQSGPIVRTNVTPTGV